MVRHLERWLRNNKKKELAQINLGAAKGIKGAVKTKLISAQYKDTIAMKTRDYIKANMVRTQDMFRPNIIPERAVQMLRPGFLSVGEWVEVDADRTPGYNSEGGIAVIIHVHDNFADVKWVCTLLHPLSLLHTYHLVVVDMCWRAGRRKWSP